MMYFHPLSNYCREGERCPVFSAFGGTLVVSLGKYETMLRFRWRRFHPFDSLEHRLHREMLNNISTSIRGRTSWLDDAMSLR